MSYRPGKGWRIITREGGARQCVPATDGLASDGNAWNMRYRATCPVCLELIEEAPFHKVPKESRTEGHDGPQFYHATCELTQ